MEKNIMYSPAFIRAKHVAEQSTPMTFDGDMRYIQLYMSFAYEPEDHKEIIRELVKKTFNKNIYQKGVI